MRFSRLLNPTSKEIPNDATLASHIYLIRAGYIQSVGGSGLYNYLPLGKKILDRVRLVVKEELDKVGCQEVSLSFVTPQSLWEESGRADEYGKELLRFKDRKDNDYLLSPTNEEAMVNLVRTSVRSYKQLPLNLYQINLKFRDEIRPRFGLMRGREFLMKDAYSFHASTEDMQREFAVMEETYKKIFTRLGLNFRVVQADSGQIGGEGSKEFMILADSGEDDIIVCDSCEYGANVEVAEEAKTGDICACGASLRMTKGIEAGHIFQLGTKYSESLKATFLNEQGKAQAYEMGTYGIGVSRLLAGIIEQNHDDKGCIWTKESAPFALHILVSNIKDEAQLALGEKLYESLKAKGLDVILDDRKDRFGAKMKDYELMGVPYGVIIGKKLKEGFVEVLTRKGMEKEEVEASNVEAFLAGVL
ncbi:Prolyl-tRNA synthetase, bacterial type [hydrothermal vent metagenome]|uniref:proline--tRNA ligase n=1 Tax=hydrothermal vent metagenome TaxID=652676 RepID=A0A1W1CV96_9ZZZZ